VSEFGFGSRKEAAMALVESFEPTYWFKQLRVAGDDLRLLRAYPGKWQVRAYRLNEAGEDKRGWIALFPGGCRGE
jgi:hypothetical protein